MGCSDSNPDIPEETVEDANNAFDPVRNASETSKSLESWLAKKEWTDLQGKKMTRNFNDVLHWLVSAKLQNEIFEKHSWEEHGSKMHGLYKYLGRDESTKIDIKIDNFHLYEMKGKYYIIYCQESDLSGKLQKYRLKDENKISQENFDSYQVSIILYTIPIFELLTHSPFISIHLS